MYIKTLEAENFRNYRHQVIDFSPGTNVLVGKNAQGKTNILEACCLFAHGRSLRTKSDIELIRFGEKQFKLNMTFCDSRREHSAMIRMNTEGKKQIKVNNVPISKLSMLMNYLNVVMFTPDDLELVKGSPSGRRRFMDEAISQLYPKYLVNLIGYNKTLMQKNALLKRFKLSGKRDNVTLDVWNEQLSEYGAELYKYRKSFIEQLSEFSRTVHYEIAKEELQLSFMPNISISDGKDIKSTIFDKLRAAKERECDAGVSQYGLQRDDFRITLNERDVKIFGSQGQQRTAVLSLKLSETEFIKSVKNEYPVLLLDDIMSELDITRREFLAEKISSKQVLITCTDVDRVKNIDKVFKVDAGTITML